MKLTEQNPECDKKYRDDETMMMGGNFIAVHSLSHPGFVDVLDDYYLGGYDVSGKKRRCMRKKYFYFVGNNNSIWYAWKK